MCGFVGLLSPGSPPEAEWLKKAANAIRHRGPDDSGIYIDPAAGFGVAHRRLSILDLSPRGHQPMVSQSGRYVIAYNGEIYNHLEIREELRRQSNQRFESTSDTETLLAAMEHWGVEKALEHFNGMFAFALWDSLDKRLCLARDRMGEKPLYVGWIKKSIVFCSELKPILRAFPVITEPSAIPQLLSLGYIPAPWSVLKGVFKLPPAHLLWLSPNDSHASKNVSEFQSAIRCYWSLPDIVGSGTHNRSTPTPDRDVVGSLDQLLADAVRQRMLSDVPLGACLSGGIDSSLIVALMQAHSIKPVKTYTIGFHEAAYDESRYARKVAAHLGSEHTEVILEPQEALALVPNLPSIYDEPFADSSQLPTLLVSRMLRRHVKVALSGDGGDELFFGYDRYRIAARLWCFYGWQTDWLRGWMARLSDRHFTKYYRIWRLGQRLSAPNFDAFYLAFASIAPNSSIFLPGALPVWQMLPGLPMGGMSREASMMYRDQTQYLPDDILVKVDRASMAMSLEMRAPFLDHRVVERAWSLSMDNKVREGRGKWILRQLLKKYLPESLFERPKQGFGIPIDDWLRGPLNEWAEHLLSPKSMARCPALDSVAVRRLWSSHKARTIQAGYLLWNLLMLLAWFEAWQV